RPPTRVPMRVRPSGATAGRASGRSGSVVRARSGSSSRSTRGRSATCRCRPCAGSNPPAPPGTRPAPSPPAPTSSAATRGRPAGEELVAWTFGVHGVNPRGQVTVTSLGSTKYPEGTVVTIPTIIGDESVSLTSCPGANLAPHLGEVRPAVAFLKALAATPDAW